MQLAVLFWFYKEPEICENRLQLIKKGNPDIKIFGLYGGKKSDAQKYKKKLSKYLSDFYVSAYHNKPKRWKWIHGDIMLLEWYLKRGRKLRWDSVVVTQWDILVIGSVKKQFAGIKKGEMFLSGLRVLDRNIEKKWNWTQAKHPKNRKDYLAFKEYIREKYNYTSKLLCCLFILELFPRDFFKKWQLLPSKEMGMLEYSLPTHAKILHTPFFKKNLGVWWFNKKDNKRNTPLNARGIKIKESFIRSELKKKRGFRIFHPYRKMWSGD